MLGFASARTSSRKNSRKLEAEQSKKLKILLWNGVVGWWIVGTFYCFIIMISPQRLINFNETSFSLRSEVAFMRWEEISLKWQNDMRHQMMMIFDAMARCSLLFRKHFACCCLVIWWFRHVNLSSDCRNRCAPLVFPNPIKSFCCNLKKFTYLYHLTMCNQINPQMNCAQPQTTLYPLFSLCSH